MVKEQIATQEEVYFDGWLIPQLDSIIYNIKHDWDFLIIITGDRMVRTGKSVLGMNICSYLANRLGTPFGLENIHFDSKEMISHAQSAPKNSVFQFDEGRETLATSKYQSRLQQDLIDYFAEAGQLNHVFVIILADFFELKEAIAVGRSEFLINVYRGENKKMVDLYGEGKLRPVVEFQRGRFQFYNRARKQKMYDYSRSSRRKDYNLVKSNFFGKFVNNYSVDEQAYRQKKADFLKRFAERKEKDAKLTKADVLRNQVV